MARFGWLLSPTLCAVFPEATFATTVGSCRGLSTRTRP